MTTNDVHWIHLLDWCFLLFRFSLLSSLLNVPSPRFICVVWRWTRNDTGRMMRPFSIRYTHRVHSTYLLTIGCGLFVRSQKCVFCQNRFLSILQSTFTCFHSKTHNSYTYKYKSIYNAITKRPIEWMSERTLIWYVLFTDMVRLTD